MQLDFPLKRIVYTTSGVIAGVAIAASVSSFADDPSSSLRTIPYEGYLDFNGEPVSASALDFNFALFPCATPGEGVGQCAPLWIASGDKDAWSFAGDWTAGWPAGADPIAVPTFAGRFTVELGAANQNDLPEDAFTAYSNLYLAINVRGTPLASLQKITPAPRAYAATEAQNFSVRGLLTVEADANVMGDLGVEGRIRSTNSPDLVVATATSTATGGALFVEATPTSWMAIDADEIQTTGTLQMQKDTMQLTQFFGAVQVDGNLALEGGTINNPDSGGITINDALTVTGTLTGAGRAGGKGVEIDEYEHKSAGYDHTARTFTSDCGWVNFDGYDMPNNSTSHIFSVDPEAGGNFIDVYCPADMFLAGLSVRDPSITGSGNDVMLKSAYCCKIR